MRIYLSSYHKYPGSRHGVAAHAVHDYLAKGLSELGHEVYYHLKERPLISLPKNITYTDRLIDNADIYHINDGSLDQDLDHCMPWVKIIHSDIRIQGLSLELKKPNWIYVSKTLANLYESERYVLNGIDPANFKFSSSKRNYLFFIVGGLNRAKMKGLDTALDIATSTKTKLLIAGTHPEPKVRAKFEKYCAQHNAVFLGPVYDEQKASLFAHAKAVLFPSRYNEACPLVVAEALMSGTPVISSDKGALSELVHPSIGFICANLEEYFKAVGDVEKINPYDCRAYAINHFHYRQMAQQYVCQYKLETNKYIGSIKNLVT